MSSKKRRRPRGHKPPVWVVREAVIQAELDERVKDEVYDGHERRVFEEQAERELSPLAAESLNEVA